MKALTLLVFAASTAQAQTSTWRVDVTVGETVEVDVDFKIGIQCDDLSILRPAIVTRGDTNYFVVEGVAPGVTWCRVGTNANLPSYLFQVVVVPRP